MALVRSPSPRNWNAGRSRRLLLNSDPRRLFLIVVGIPDHGALRAHGVGELDLGAIANVRLDLLPTAIFGVDFFARSTDGQKTCQGIEFRDSLLQFRNDSFALSFRLHALGN